MLRFVLLYLGPTISLGDHSLYWPVYDEGRNVTLFLIIMTNGSAQDLKTQWEIPNPPESEGRVSFKNHIVDRQTANSTIVIADIQPVDEGIHAVNISNGCTSKCYSQVFHVYIDGPVLEKHQILCYLRIRLSLQRPDYMAPKRYISQQPIPGIPILMPMTFGGTMMESFAVLMTAILPSTLALEVVKGTVHL